MKERRKYVVPSVTVFSDDDLAAAEADAYMSGACPGNCPGVCNCNTFSAIPSPFDDF